MDFRCNSQVESVKLEQIVHKFLLKCLHIILDSRIPSFHPHTRNSRVRNSDKWFNLVLGDRPASLDNLNFWHGHLTGPMIIDIVLAHEASNSSSVNNFFPTSRQANLETVIERWVIQYESLQSPTPHLSSDYKMTYKKSIILLRSLYAQMRLLPAYRIFRQLTSSNQSYKFDIIYKVSSFSNPFSQSQQETMKEYSFIPVEALPGRLCVSLSYRPTLSDFNLELSTSIPALIITDYVGSPTTDPSRTFLSRDKDAGASFPFRGVRASPDQRPHSWTSGFHRAAPVTRNQSLGVSPLGYRSTPVRYDLPSPQADFFGQRVQQYRLPIHHRGTSYDEYQLSPPFSPFSSPSPPENNPMQPHYHSETAPVSIPLPVSGKSFRYLTPNFSDPSRYSLPPLSPRSTKNDPSSEESPSSIRGFRRTEALKAGDMGLTNHSFAHRVSRDNKDDSGRFSGLLSSSGSPRIGFSRSSSRLSFQDESDDCPFSCPFEVDDVDTAHSHFSQNLYVQNNESSSSVMSPMGRKSEDAAVGVLVHVLRTAPPLRQDLSCYSSHSLRNEFEGGVGTSSGFFMPRKTADALDELKSYREMKDLLLSKSGSRIISKEV